MAKKYKHWAELHPKERENIMRLPVKNERRQYYMAQLRLPIGIAEYRGGTLFTRKLKNNRHALGMRVRTVGFSKTTFSFLREQEQSLRHAEPDIIARGLPRENHKYNPAFGPGVSVDGVALGGEIHKESHEALLAQRRAVVQKCNEYLEQHKIRVIKSTKITTIPA